MSDQNEAQKAATIYASKVLGRPWCTVEDHEHHAFLAGVKWEQERQAEIWRTLPEDISRAMSEALSESKKKHNRVDGCPLQAVPWGDKS